MYRCESWNIKKAEHQIIDAFKLWCWRRLLKFPWSARRSNQSCLKEINPEYSLEGLKLKLQYFGHLIRRADSLEKSLVPGKTEGRGRKEDRGWDGWMVSPTQRSLSKLWEIAKDREASMLQSTESQRVRHDLVTEQQWLNEAVDSLQFWPFNKSSSCWNVTHILHLRSHLHILFHLHIFIRPS